MMGRFLHPDGICQFLHVVDEFAGMVAVRHGMMDKDRDRELYPPVCFKIFPELDKWKKEFALRVCVLCKGGIAQPGKAGNGAEVRRLSGTCLDDPGHIPILLDVRRHCPVERAEVFMVIAPDIREGLGFRMKKSVVWYDFLPIAQLSVLIEAHPEFFVPVDSSHDDIEHHREEAKASCLLLLDKAGDVQVGIQVIFAFDLVVIIIEIDAPFPSGTVNKMKLTVHVCLFCLQR